MAKQIKQYRYYKEKHPNNQPDAIAFRNLVSGSVFSNFVPITQLGIQALPGMKFYLNNSTNPIIIGQTGIYELNLEGLAEINALSFDAESINAIIRNDNAYLIIDTIYDDDAVKEAK